MLVGLVLDGDLEKPAQQQASVSGLLKHSWRNLETITTSLHG